MELTPDTVVAKFLQELTDECSPDIPDVETDKIYVVGVSGNYKGFADIEVSVRAKSPEEARAKVIAAGNKGDVWVYTDHGSYEMYDIYVDFVDEVNPEEEGIEEPDYE